MYCLHTLLETLFMELCLILNVNVKKQYLVYMKGVS